MTTPIRILLLLSAISSIGCSSMESPTYAADTLHKIRLHEKSTVIMPASSDDTTTTPYVMIIGGTRYVMIQSGNAETLYAVMADQRNVVAIPRERIISIEAVAARRHMVAIDLGVDPTLAAYTQLAEKWVAGGMARYRSPFGLFGRYMFNTGPTDSIEAVEFGAEVRFLVLGGALRGFFVGPTTGYGLVTRTLRPLSLKGWQRVGLTFGWQWFPIYSFGVGFSASVNGYIYGSGNRDKGYRSFDGYYRLQFGYAW
jgi:hypothetical protein